LLVARNWSIIVEASSAGRTRYPVRDVTLPGVMRNGSIA
jgi:hypothetical protein